MEPIPDEWIDRLFGCMHEFYGDRWTKLYKNAYQISLYKTIWKNGLHGLSYDQIKGALRYYRRLSHYNKQFLPPLVTEFYHYASDVLPSA